MSDILDRMQFLLNEGRSRKQGWDYAVWVGLEHNRKLRESR